MDFPVIDPTATGRNIVWLRKARGLTVKDLQVYFGFEEPVPFINGSAAKPCRR